MQVLLRMLKKTRRLIKRPERQEDDDHEYNQSDEVEVLEAEELTDDDLELAPDDPSPVVMDPLYDPTQMEHPLEAGFGRNFDFLHLLATGDKGLKQVNLKLCYIHNVIFIRNLTIIYFL